MRKLLLLISAFAFTFFAGIAQDRSVTGTVTSSDDGSAIPGVSVLVKGTATGVVTDMNGSYKVSVPSSGGTLVFSFIGLKTQEVEVGSRSTIDVAMESDVQQLSEVVVTALNVPREKKTLGYATQTIDQENLRVARETNLNQALAGKVAGVQVISGKGANFGEAAIRIRGVRGLSGSSPLYVLDGIIVNDIASINMDNIASINVLKGANAAALYGIRATDGVVMMTSKKGTAGKLDISFNNTTTFETVALLPEYQNEYGGGYVQEWETTFEYDPNRHDPALAGLNGAFVPEFYADESWGPRLDGTRVAQWDAFTPGMPGYGQTRPWEAHPDNVRDFFDTGVTINNSFSVAKASDEYNLNLTVTDIRRTGILPNTNQDRKYLNLGTMVKVLDNLSLTTYANYSKISTFGNMDDGYNSLGANINQWWQRQLDTDLMRDYYRLPNGTYTTWNIQSPNNLTPKYWDNPFTAYFGNVAQTAREIFSGAANLDYKPIEGMTVRAGMTRNARTIEGDSRIASGTIDQDRYNIGMSTFREDNYSASVTYEGQINEDFSYSVLGGYNFMDREWKSLNAGTSGGLSVPDLYNMKASTDRPNVGSDKRRLQNESVFISGNVGFRETVFVDALYRTDWTSALPSGVNDFSYFQVSGSFLLSEVLPANDILSYAKLRGSYSQTGTEIGPYFNQNVYGVGAPVGSYATMGEPNVLIDPNLAATPTLSTEIGTELKFLANRLTFDFSYFTYDTKGAPLTLSIPNETGIAGLRTNDGEFLTKGWEVALGGTPVKTADLTWTTNFNFSQFNAEVIRLDAAGNLDAITLGNAYNGTSTWGGWGGINARAAVGEEWATIYGTKYRRNDAGEILVSDSGFPLTDANQPLGSALPDFTGGFFNRIEYKNFIFSFTFDWQIGGKIHSFTNMFAHATGISANTVGNNDKGNPQRDPVADGGGMSWGGVVESTGEANDIYVDANSYYWGMFGLHEQWLFDATFVKLREVRLGYSLPTGLLDATPFSRAAISVVANNPLLIYSAIPMIDPSEVNGEATSGYSSVGGAWVEGGALPPTRTIGFDIKLGF